MSTLNILKELGIKIIKEKIITGLFTAMVLGGLLNLKNL